MHEMSLNPQPIEAPAVPTEAPVVEDEHEYRSRMMRRFVEYRVLGIDPVLDDDEVADTFAGMAAAEKVNLLYEKVLARQETRKEFPQEPTDPYLLTEIQSLWADEAVRELFLNKYSEARTEAKAFRLSQLGQGWDAINIAIDAKQRQYDHLAQDLFLERITRPDQLSATKSRAARLAKNLIEKRQQRDDVMSLKELPVVVENTDIVAQIHYDRLKEMHRQAEETGFVWLPSREDILHRAMGALQNGRWPVLKGEAGTGKSELADAAAVKLTGELPTHVACSPKTSERNLISDKEIDPETGGSYDAYRPLMAAATGFEDSRQEEPTYQRGRIVRLDEFNRLDQSGVAYSLLKEARQLRPGSSFFGKQVLPGFSAIGTENPPGSRYPDRSEPDAAMRREIAEIDVDYPPQGFANPELYEFMLATLMDTRGHITVAKEELAPDYIEVPVDPPRPVAEDDPRLVVAEDRICPDPTHTSNGYAWRLSFAIREIQDAFIFGNSQTVPETALRYTVDNSGKATVVERGGEPLTLRSSTITLGELASWM